MAYEATCIDVGTIYAGEDLREKQYLMAVPTGGAIVVAGAGVQCIGVIKNKPNTGEAVQLGVAGVQKVMAGDAISAGAKVTPEAGGRVVTAATTSFAVGWALEDAVDGQIISVLLWPLGHNALS